MKKLYAKVLTGLRLWKGENRIKVTEDAKAYMTAMTCISVIEWQCQSREKK